MNRTEDCITSLAAAAAVHTGSNNAGSVEQCRLREGMLQGTAASFSWQKGYLRDLAAVGKRLGECLPDLVLAAKLPAEALHKDGGAVALPAGCTQRSACR